MSKRKGKHLDQRLLIAGYVMAVIGYGALLIGVARSALACFGERDTIDVVMMLVWVWLGVAMINSGNRPRRAYRAGMQVGSDHRFRPLSVV